MGKVRHFVEQSWLLIVASFCFGLLIAATNAGLARRIERNRITKLNQLSAGLIPQAKYFDEVDAKIEIESLRGKKTQVQVFKAVSEANECVGWAFSAAGPGFADKVELVIAVDKDFGTIRGFDVLMSNETPGFGDQIKYDYFRKQFEGAPVQKLELVKTGEPQKVDDKIVGISGATYSSEAVVDIFNTHVEKVKAQLQTAGLIGNGK